jgi:hypothetical protein
VGTQLELFDDIVLPFNIREQTRLFNGDVVRVVPLDVVEKDKLDALGFVSSMKYLCGQLCHVNNPDENDYVFRLDEDVEGWSWISAFVTLVQRA